MNENRRPTQSQRVMRYMENHGSITQLEALRDLGIMRLGARIWELKAAGVPIESTFVKVKNRYGENVQIKQYSLAEEPCAQMQSAAN